tara:strand:+ start:229 stop:492 length:264 start_codon:yes stop_codon:yes gene_type:complete
MRYIVGSQVIEDLKAAVKEHGGENVYWLSDSTNERDAMGAGLPRNHILSIQNLQSMKNATELLGEGWVEYKATPKPKAKAKKAEKSE